MGLVNPNLLGRTIGNGQLRLNAVLGSGSGGVVFLSTDEAGSSSSLYAVKCLLRAPPGTPKHDSQWREIRNHRAMSHHPHIVTLHQVIEEEDYIFLVLDYCAGGDLLNFLADNRALAGNMDRIKTMFLQLIGALMACHKAGIYHRDIKPENIFCNEDGTEIYLGDFGLSTTNAFSQKFGVGSYSYMSPECIHYDVIADGYSARRNDVWSLGPILSYMISGRHPWRVAATTDESFKAFLRNPNYLRTILPLSEKANLLLRHIFTRKEKNRISLEYLRQMVEEIDSFFMSPTEIRQATPEVQYIAATYFPTPLFHISSYGIELAPLDERRIYKPNVAVKAEENAEQPQYTPRPAPAPRVSEIQQINRSDPTNPDGVPSEEGHLAPDLKLPAPPPKIYLPMQRYRRDDPRSSNTPPCTRDRVDAWNLSRFKRAVVRIWE